MSVSSLTKQAAPKSAASTIAAAPSGSSLRTGLWLACLRLKEWLACDSRVCRWAIALAGLIAYYLLALAGRSKHAFNLLFRLHRGDFGRAAERIAERRIRAAARGQDAALAGFLRDYPQTITPTGGSRNFIEDPRRMLGNAIFVIKAARDNERGVLAVHYNHVFPLLARSFDLERIAQRYYLFLEPSWSGYCNQDLLCYLQYPFTVFVQGYEPRDVDFLSRIQGNFVRVPTGSNWWVDHRIFSPTGCEKDCDLAMVACWGEYKRHYRFFEALSRLRRQGRRPRVLLIGAGGQWKRQHIERQADYFGIRDQLEIHERVPYGTVNDLVNRAKVHVLWSRKEGIPRAVTECLFADVPSIVREGLNYGYQYPFINEQTGAFASEASLPRVIQETLERAGEMAPRQWVMENISCQKATETLSETIGAWAKNNGQPWTETPVVKMRHLHTMDYWDQADRERFADDYAFLREACRKQD